MAPTRAEKPAKAPGRPRSEQARRNILTVAYRLLKSKRLNSITTQEIARKAGVSTATLYRWWSSKEEIIFEACCERLRLSLSFRTTAPPWSASAIRWCAERRGYTLKRRGSWRA